MKRESGYNGCGLMAFLVCMMVPAMVMGALGAPVNPSSDSHKAGVCNSDRTVNMAWDAPEPVESVQGYSVLWDSLSDTLPEATLATTQTHATSPYLDIGNYYYVHIRAVDNEDNWGETALHVGPFCIKTYEDPCDASGTAGDINGDERLDLSDAILGLNLVSAGENTIEAEADVNQDDLIGLAEVIYILKRMASCQGFQPGDCLRPEEVELARLVNEYRQRETA